jgi:hypothetical protein
MFTYARISTMKSAIYERIGPERDEMIEGCIKVEEFE